MAKARLDPPTTVAQDSDVSQSVKRYLEQIHNRIGQKAFHLPMYTSADMVGDLAPGAWKGSNFSAIVLIDDGGTVTPCYSDGTNWLSLIDNSVIV